LEIDRSRIDGPLIANIRQQGHEAGPLHCIRYDMLTDSRATRFASSHQPTMAIDKFLQQLDILIVNIGRTWSLAVNVKWILADGFDFELWFLTNEFFLELWQANNPLTQLFFDTVAAKETFARHCLNRAGGRIQSATHQGSAVSRAIYYANSLSLRKPLFGQFRERTC
jgi:hypothetical protein